MTPTNDLLLAANGDFLFSDGDFFVDISDEQHIAHIMVADKGNYREHPLLGVGIHRWVNAPIGFSETTALKNKIGANLTYDNYSVLSIDIKEGNISINAQRTT